MKFKKFVKTMNSDNRPYLGVNWLHVEHWKECRQWLIDNGWERTEPGKEVELTEVYPREDWVKGAK